ncbi:ERBB-3 BINDING PROTEIN 1 [Asimina triloba]
MRLRLALLPAYVSIAPLLHSRCASFLSNSFQKPMPDFRNQRLRLKVGCSRRRAEAASPTTRNPSRAEAEHVACAANSKIRVTAPSYKYKGKPHRCPNAPTGIPPFLLFILFCVHSPLFFYSSLIPPFQTLFLLFYSSTQPNPTYIEISSLYLRFSILIVRTPLSPCFRIFVGGRMSDEETKEEKELDLTSPEVVTKYKSAAEILNKALQLAVSECKPKAKIVDVCEKGDAFIREQTGNMYKNSKKKIERGVAFPTCISVNNTICHFSPLASDETVLEEHDMVKIDMGCHIDGFIAVVAHTHVIQAGPVTGRAADVIAAANTAAEVAIRLVRPGRKIVDNEHDSSKRLWTMSTIPLKQAIPDEFFVKKNKDVTEAIQKVAAAYDCKIVEGVLSHQLKQFVIDGNKVILSVSSPETRVDDAEFEENEVYAIDIVTSTGDGKPKLLDERQTTIYKRAVDKNYHLKMKSSRFIFSEINQKFPIMPFTARALEEKRARLGLVECVNHDLLQPYPVLHEKPAAMLARFGNYGDLNMDCDSCNTAEQLLDKKPRHINYHFIQLLNICMCTCLWQIRDSGLRRLKCKITQGQRVVDSFKLNVDVCDLVAHIKFTVLLMPNGSDRITSHSLQELQPTKTIDDDPEIKAWLSLGTKTKKKGGGKKKKGKKGDTAEAEPMDTTNGATQE